MHECRCFKDGDAKSTLSVPVGNVVDTTKLMYEFSSSESKYLHIIATITIAIKFLSSFFIRERNRYQTSGSPLSSSSKIHKSGWSTMSSSIH